MEELEEWVGAELPFARPKPGDAMGPQLVGIQVKELLCEEGPIEDLLQESSPVTAHCSRRSPVSLEAQHTQGERRVYLSFLSLLESTALCKELQPAAAQA